MLVRSLYRYGYRALVGGAQPIHGWWAPIAQCYKERVGATARSTRFTAPPHTPHPTNPNRPEGGKLRHRRRRGPLLGSDAPGVIARRSTASYVTPSSPSRHCIPCVKPRPPLRPRPERWLRTPCSCPTPMVCAFLFPSVYLSSCFRCSRSRSRWSCWLSVMLKFVPE
jgi:hypothetical protein